MKFEEARFVKDNIRKLYTISEVTNFRDNNPKLFAEIKEYLFCPECELPHLKHVKKQSDFFSTVQGEVHNENCSFSCSPISQTEFKELLIGDDNLNRIKQRLENCLLLLFSEKQKLENPFIKRNSNLTHIVKNNEIQKSTATNKNIPRKLITNNLNEDHTNKLMIFYGKVKIKWELYDSCSYLRIYHPDSSSLICSLTIPSYVMKRFDKKPMNNDVCGIAFITMLECKNKEYNGNVKIFYNAKIDDSRKITFYLETL